MALAAQGKATPILSPSSVSATSSTAHAASVLPSSTTSSSYRNQKSSVKDENNGKLFWQLDVDGIDRWVRSIHVLFPRKPAPRIDKNGNVIVHASDAAAGVGGGVDALGRGVKKESFTGTSNETPAAPALGIKETPPQTMEEIQAAEALKQEQLKLQKQEEDQYIRNVAIANRLLGNLLTALRNASNAPTATNGDVQDGMGPSAKRMKTEHGLTTLDGASSMGTEASATAYDAYHILDPSFSRGKDVVHIPGAILSRLSLGGLTNALSGAVGGVVDVATAKPLNVANAAVAPVGTKPQAVPSSSASPEETIPTSSNLTVKELLGKARSLHRAISARVEMDMLNSTPSRIVEMLCPEVGLDDIENIKKRIYNTVVLGQGTGGSLTSAALEAESDFPVAARVGVHDVEKFQKCKVCGNNDQSLFILDRKNGDLICSNCGTVATESIMHEGSQFRKFEGEADRNHHGDTPNPLYSNAHNMSTTLGGVSFQTGAGMGGFGSGQKRGLETILRNAHAYTEMNVSQFGKDEKRTRVGYKDRQKKDAFVKMAHVGDALNLHEAVVQRAKELFAGFRDDRELVQQFKGVVAACLCEAFDQLSRDGRQILRRRTGEEEGEEEEEKLVGARANRRNELHSANLAGKGSIFVHASIRPDAENGGGDGESGGGNGDKTATGAMENKPAATWDLDDCRSWLLEASRSIAKQWSEQQKQQDEKVSSTTRTGSTVAAANQIPNGTLDELEGKLVEHTLTLCDHLESELKEGGARAGSTVARSGGRNKVVTPRVQDMAKLGIKWQHSHERGSGGKGGVGNSGAGLGAKPGCHDGRTAGQILILKTSKKLGAVLKDPLAGDAFHRELRALLGRQEARKKKGLRDEATRQRFKQMERKPWLQARAQR